MEVLTITFTKQGTEIISGIPEFVAITTNSPAMIFYTLDGSLPTVFSLSYIEPIEMPTNAGQVILSAVAYYLDGYGNLVPSSVLTTTYRTDNSKIGHRRTWFEGITYIYPGGLNIPFWYDGITGAPKVFLDLPIETFKDNTLISDRDAQGNFIPDSDAQVIPTPPDQTATQIDNDLTPISSPSDHSTFDPNARVIIIDGRTPRNTDDVLLINSPYMTLRNSEEGFNAIDFTSTQGTNYISGSLIKPHYNRAKGIIVFYYYDSNCGRQVKSIQKLPNPTVNPNKAAVISNPVVFEWNNFGIHQNV